MILVELVSVGCIMICVIIFYFVIMAIKKEKEKQQNTPENKASRKTEALEELNTQGKYFAFSSFSLDSEDLDFLYENGWEFIATDASTYDAVFKKRKTT